MSSSAALHFQSPINSADAPPHSSSLHFNADCLNPSARARSRPRLAKLRKQSASQQARSRNRAGADDDGAGAGFNPFRADQVSGNGTILESGFLNCRGDNGFVFGAGKVESDSARDLKGGIGSGGVEFVFGAGKSDEGLRKNGESVTETVCGEGGKVGSNSEGELKSGVFVFGASRNNLNSGLSTEKGKCSVGLGDSVGERECKYEFECGQRDCFGGSYSGRESSVKVEKKEPVGCGWNLDRGMGAFGVKMGMNGNSDTGADRYDHLGNGDKCKSGCGSANGIPATYGGVPARNLSDEMEKLNIKHSEGADISKNSHANGCAAGFVFGGNDMGFGYSSVSSRTETGGQQFCAHSASGNVGVQNGTACGIASDSTGIHSTPSTSQEGFTDFQSGKVPGCYVSEDSKANGASVSFSFSSIGIDSHPNFYASTGHSSSADGDNSDNFFASTPEASKESFADFKPPTWDPSCFKENLFPKLNRKVESTQKGRSCMEKGSKCRRRKLKPHSLNKKQTGPDHLSKEDSSLKTPDSSGVHSPMDFSPYQETTASAQDVKASKGLNDLHSKIPTDYKDGNLPTMRREDTSTTDRRHGDLDSNKLDENLSVHSSGPEMVWPNLKTEQFCGSSAEGASACAGVDFTSNIERQKDATFCFVPGPNESMGKDFSFASSSVVGTPSLKRQHKKKFRRKGGCNTFVISPRVNGKFVSSVQFSPHSTANMSSHSDVMDRSQINGQCKDGDVASSNTIPSSACDKWRHRYRP